MDLLILGASARAAAASAIRIGLRPTCIDLFGDADLAPGFPTFRVDRGQYPEGLFSIARGLSPMPWLYTGAIENRPDLVDGLAETHPLLGNDGQALRGVRDPVALAGAVKGAGLSAPGIRLVPTGLPVDGSWLQKPLASAGGRGIRPWLGRDREPGRSNCYYQERVEGLSLSALFVGESGGQQCLGIGRQYVGKAGNRFAYRGSLAPWPVGDDVRVRLERLGQAIGSRFGLIGLFGIDFILKEGQPWPIEVNPRYTASVEVLEWSLGRSLLAEHLKATIGRMEGQVEWKRPETFASKAILHADRPFRWPWEAGRWQGGGIEFPEIADIPQVGTKFRAGEPVLNVFARGDSLRECRKALGARVAGWRRRLRALDD